MIPVEAKRFKALLIAKRDEIVRQSSQRQGILIVQSNEQVETVQLADDREFAARALDRESKTLMQVDAALNRLRNGEFGDCLECEEPISAKRPAALPWASYCLQCQTMHDSSEATDRVGHRLAA